MIAGAVVIVLKAQVMEVGVTEADGGLMNVLTVSALTRPHPNIYWYRYHSITHMHVEMMVRPKKYAVYRTGT